MLKSKVVGIFTEKDFQHFKFLFIKKKKMKTLFHEVSSSFECLMNKIKRTVNL